MNAGASTGDDTGRFLGRSTLAEMESVFLSDSRLTGALATKGFGNLHVSMDTSSSIVHKVLLRDKGPHEVVAPANNPTPSYMSRQSESVLDDKLRGLLLMELAVSEGRSLSTLKGFDGPHHDPRTAALLEPLREWEDTRLIVWEWLQLQDPTRSFKPGEHPLPGQKYPGLSVISIIFDSFGRWIADKCPDRDGSVNVPLYFHNAALYAGYGCLFLSPEVDGVFSTLRSDLAPYIKDPEVGLAVVSRAIFSGLLFHIPTGKRVKWIPGQTQITPVSDRMAAFFSSDEYVSVRDAFTSSGVFRLDFGDPGFASAQDFEDALCLDEIDTRH